MREWEAIAESCISKTIGVGVVVNLSRLSLLVKGERRVLGLSEVGRASKINLKIDQNLLLNILVTGAPKIYWRLLMS
jgi:hypothetical protein